MIGDEMKRISKIVLAPAWALLFLFSCGYSEDRPSQDFDYYDSEWLFPCALRGEQLSSLLEKNIAEDLDCLKERLKIYNLYTRRNEGQDVIARPTLEAFVEEYFPEQKDVLRPQIHLMFELNSLLFNESQESITGANLDRFFDIMIVLNREVVAIKQIFSEHTRQKAMATVESNLDITEKFKEAHQRIKDGILPLINTSREYSPRPQNTPSPEPLQGHPLGGLELRAFYGRIQALFPVYFNSSIEQQLNNFLGIKKLFLGGNKETITSSELSAFIDKIPGIATAIFESYLATQGPTLDGPTSPYSAYISTLNQLAPYMHQQSDEEIIFERRDLSRLIEGIFSESPKLESYHKWFDSIKSHLVDGVLKHEAYTVKDIRTLLTLGEISLHFLQFWHETEAERHKLADEAPLGNEEREAIRTVLADKGKQLALNLKTMELKEADLFTPSMEFGDFIALQAQSGEPQGEPGESPWKSLTSFSKLFLLGGSGEHTNFYELQKLWDKLPLLSELFFDLYTTDFSRWTQSEFHQRMFHAIQSVKNLMHSKHSHLPLFSDRQLASWLKLWRPSIDWTSFLGSAREVKKSWPGGHPEHYSSADVSTLLDSAQDFWIHLWFTETAYDLYQNQNTVAKDGPDFLSQSSILKNNNFGPEFPVPDWANKFHQYVENHHRYNDDSNADNAGLIQIAATGQVIDKLAEIFGHRQSTPQKTLSSDEPRGEGPLFPAQYAWNASELTTMLEAFEDFFSHYGFNSDTLSQLATSNLLFADLFLFHSNGDFQMDTHEAKELNTLVLAAMEMSDLFANHLGDRCPPSHGDQSADVAVTYDKTCVKTHFFDILLKDMPPKPQLEKLPRYVDHSPPEERQLFLQSLANFIIGEDSEQFTQTQITLILQMVMGIEATYARYDSDHNNYLDAQELEASFQTHQNVIINLLEQEGVDTKYAQTVYLYVLKNGKLPGGTKVAICHRIPYFCSLNGLSVSRNHIATVLDNLLSEEGELQNRILYQNPMPSQAQENEESQDDQDEDESETSETANAHKKLKRNLADLAD